MRIFEDFYPIGGSKIVHQCQPFFTEKTMPFNYNDCMKEGLLRKIPPSKDKATQSLKKAREWLKEAGNSLKGDAVQLVNSGFLYGDVSCGPDYSVFRWLQGKEPCLCGKVS